MEIIRGCSGCGNTHIETSQLVLEDRPSFFVKCQICDSVCTIVHAVRDEAIKQWNNLYCWKEIERLEKQIAELKQRELIDTNKLTEDQRLLKHRFEVLLEHYIKVRLEISGSFGNLKSDRRREVMLHEISAELGWKV